MDLVLPQRRRRPTTSATRSMRVLGPPTIALGRRARARRERDTHVAVGGHAARARRHLLLPALHARAGARRLDQPTARSTTSASGSTIPPAEAWGVATFYALFSLDAAAAGRRARLRRHRVHRARRATSSSPSSSGTVGPAQGQHPRQRPRRSGCESPCLGAVRRRPPRWSTAVRRDRRARRRSPPATCRRASRRMLARRRRAGRDAAAASVPQAGDPSLRLLRARRHRRPDEPRQLPRARRLRGAARGARDRARRRASARSPTRSSSAAAAPRSRPAASGRRSRATPTRPHYLICNADESEPGTFKDRVLLEDDPFCHRRGDDDRRLRHRLRARLPLHPRRVPAGVASGCVDAIDRGARPRLPRRQHPRPGRPLRHRAAQGRGRVHLRRGDGALQLDRGLPRRAAQQAAVPGRQSGLFGKPTVINNVETLVNVPGIVLDGGAAFAQIGTKDSTGTRLFCLSGQRRRGRASTRRRSASRCASCSTWPAACSTGARCGRSCSAAPPGVFVTPDELDIELSFEATREAGATHGLRASSWSSTTPSTCRRSSCASRRSSATSRAGSACRAASAPCARRRRSRASSTAARAGRSRTSTRCSTRSRASMRDASICGLGQTAADAIESALRKLDIFETGGQPMSPPHAAPARPPRTRRAARSTARP